MAREEALRNRHMKDAERLKEHTKRLPQLSVGDHVRIQNQVGPHPLKWDKTGIVIAVRQFDQYAIRVDGSGRVTLRNRKFLRRFIPMNPSPPKLTIDNDLGLWKPETVHYKPLHEESLRKAQTSPGNNPCAKTPKVQSLSPNPTKPPPSSVLQDASDLTNNHAKDTAPTDLGIPDDNNSGPTGVSDTNVPSTSIDSPMTDHSLTGSCTNNTFWGPSQC